MQKHNTQAVIEEMQSYYGERAAEYDASMGYDNPEVIDQLQPILEPLKQIASGRHVLELACGPCFWTQQIAHVTEHITATDFNQATLEQAWRKGLLAEPRDA